MTEVHLQSEALERASRAGKREWLGLAVIALPCMLYSMDLTVMNLALPALAQALRPTSAQLLWIVDSYGFLLAGCLVTMGMLGDRIGRRRVLLLGAAGFELASMLCAFSTSAPMLIVARGLLGIAGATIAPSTLSLIRNLFANPSQRTFAIGIWAMSFSLGATIGPLAGGLLLERCWWGSAFLIGAPVMLLLLALGPWLLPEFRAEPARLIDWRSSILSALGILPIIYGIKRLALEGFSFAPIASIAIGIAVGVFFVKRQRELSQPLLDLSLFRARVFRLALVANTLTIFVTFGTFIFIAQYFQQVCGLSARSAGYCTLPSAIGFIGGSLLAPQLAKRYLPTRAIAGCMLVSALALALLSCGPVLSSLGSVIASSVLLAIGSAPAVTLATDLVVGSAPAERAGAASAISETSGEFGGACGIAILGTIGSAAFRSRMHEFRSDASLDTLSAVLALVGENPDVQRMQLLVYARRAFIQGMQAALLTASSVALMGAVLLFIHSRPVRRERWLLPGFGWRKPNGRHRTASPGSAPAQSARRCRAN